MIAIAQWRNGSATDFGSVCPGPNPGWASKMAFWRNWQTRNTQNVVPTWGPGSSPGKATTDRADSRKLKNHYYYEN